MRESGKLIPHSERHYGPDTSWQRHDHARRPSCDTAIEGSAQRARGTVWAEPSVSSKNNRVSFVKRVAVPLVLPAARNDLVSASQLPALRKANLSALAVSKPNRTIPLLIHSPVSRGNQFDISHPCRMYLGYHFRCCDGTHHTLLTTPRNFTQRRMILLSCVCKLVRFGQ